MIEEAQDAQGSDVFSAAMRSAAYLVGEASGIVSRVSRLEFGGGGEGMVAASAAAARDRARAASRASLSGPTTVGMKRGRSRIGHDVGSGGEGGKRRKKGGEGDGDTMEEETPDDISSPTCAVCLLQLSDTTVAPMGYSEPFELPCCAAHCHAGCLQRMLQMRTCRDNCPACQETFPDDLQDTLNQLTKGHKRKKASVTKELTDAIDTVEF